jgi:hypothetical protein
MNFHRHSCRSLQALALAACFLGVSGGGAPLWAADAPASAPATASVSQPASMPAEPPTVYMWELVHANVENGQLVLVPASKEPLDIGTISTVGGIPGKVHVQTRYESWQVQVYRMLTVGKMYHFQSARQRDAEFAISGMLTDTDAKTSDVVFYTNTAAAAGATTAPAVHAALTISRREKSAGAAQQETVVLKLEAASFGEMCVKHPDEVKKYIAPIFQELDLTGVFFVDLKDALHVFAAQLPPDPKITAQVQALLPRLDDDSPDVRGAAEAELKMLGDAGLAPVQAIDLSRQPMQTQITLKMFLINRGAGVDDPRLAKPDFLLLCLALDDKKIPALAKAKLEKLRGKPVDVDLAAPVEDRRKIVQKMLFDAWAPAAPSQTQK